MGRSSDNTDAISLHAARLIVFDTMRREKNVGPSKRAARRNRELGRRVHDIEDARSM